MADIDSLCRAVAFNWLLLGTDAHVKNYSLLLSGQDVRFAPLYDIASALPYGDHPRKLRLAQEIGGENRPALIEAQHWDRLARSVRVDAGELRQSIVDMIDQIPDALSDAVKATPVGRGSDHMTAQFQDSTNEWLASCRRGIG
jgi:serine/threonine-protein kinase HipA